MWNEIYWKKERTEKYIKEKYEPNRRIVSIEVIDFKAKNMLLN